MSTFFHDDYGYSLRQRRQDEEGDEYTVRFAAEDERRRVEWVEEFGDSFPYVTNGKSIHAAVMARSRG